MRVYIRLLCVLFTVLILFPKQAGQVGGAPVRHAAPAQLAGSGTTALYFMLFECIFRRCTALQLLDA